MTEVPEHLLQRSRERRAALGLGGGEAEGEAPSKGVAETTAAEPAPTATDVEEAPAAEVVPEPEPEPAIPVPKARVPMWAMPVLVLLPFWAIIYSGAFGDREEAGPVHPGAAVFSANCASCHGPSGGGGTGPALNEVAETFPAFGDHVDWVTNGSEDFTGRTYGATNKPASGGMPAFGESLTEKELTDVVCYERTAFGGEEPPQECAETEAEDSESESAGG